MLIVVFRNFANAPNYGFLKCDTVSFNKNLSTFRRKHCLNIQDGVKHSERKLSTRLHFVISVDTGNFCPSVFISYFSPAGVCKSLNLGDTEAAGTAEVPGGAFKATAGVHPAAASQDTGAAGWFRNLTWI